VRMPTAKIVSAGVELAVGEAAWSPHGAEAPPRLIFEPELVVRRSTGPVATTAAGAFATPLASSTGR